jgi:solute carrier family 25 citrate transporter 1
MAAKPQKSLTKIGLAGGVAGSMEIAVTYPLEYIKTNIQLQHGAAGTGSGYSGGAVHCFRETVKTRGLRGLYSGCAPWFLFAGPRSAVRFAAFDFLSEDASKTASWDFLCGLGAGACEAALCQTPNQSIQIKLLHDASPAVVVKRYSHFPFPRAVAAIARHHGVRSFYDGLYPAVAKGALTNCVRFVGYKGLLRAAGKEEHATALESFGAGAVAGAISAVISQPVDTVKANMMGLDRSLYKSSLDCARAIVKADGARALWNGGGPRLVRVFFEVGLQFALFGEVSKLVDKVW